jgi:hypothetical protein
MCSKDWYPLVLQTAVPHRCLSYTHTHTHTHPCMPCCLRRCHVATAALPLTFLLCIRHCQSHNSAKLPPLPRCHRRCCCRSAATATLPMPPLPLHCRYRQRCASAKLPPPPPSWPPPCCCRRTLLSYLSCRRRHRLPFHRHHHHSHH